MKKLLIILLFLLISFQNSFSRDFEINEFMNYLDKNYVGKDDEELFKVADYWQTPQEFNKNKAGDCEDFALFIKSILTPDVGYTVTCYVYSYYDYKREYCGHAIAVVRDLIEHKIYITSNANLIKIENDYYSDIQAIESIYLGGKLIQLYKVADDFKYGKINDYTRMTHNLIFIKSY